MALFILLANGCQKTSETENQESESAPATEITLEDQNKDNQNNLEQETPVNKAQYETIENAQSYIKEGVFKDPESGISFKVPSDANYIEGNKSGANLENRSFRIQNYDPTPGSAEKLALSENEYYIEVAIENSEDSSLQDCATSLASVETVETKDGKRYMGLPDQGGDSGGERYAICFQGKGPDYYIQITENNSKHPVRDLIKNSFDEE